MELIAKMIILDATLMIAKMVDHAQQSWVEITPAIVLMDSMELIAH